MRRDLVQKVLLVCSEAASQALRGTALFRGDIERAYEPDPLASLARAEAIVPDLIVVDTGEPDGARQLLRALKAHGATRRTPVVVWAHALPPEDAADFGRLGANAVVSDPVQAEVWDQQLGMLLELPLRRATRLPVRLRVWCRQADEALDGVALNLSAYGMLIETARPLPHGSQWELSFRLDGDGEMLEAVAQVVRRAETQRACSGLQFMRLPGPTRARIQAFIAAREPTEPSAKSS